MSKVYKNPGKNAFSTYDEAAAKAMKSDASGWIYEVKESNVKHKDYIGWTFYAMSTASMEALSNLGFIPRAKVEVKVEIHPMFTGAIVNDAKKHLVGA